MIFSGVVFHAVVFRDMWSDGGVVGFRPSGVRTAFEQQTGELSNALSLYFTDARCVWRHGFISCHAIWEDVWSHTI